MKGCLQQFAIHSEAKIWTLNMSNVCNTCKFDTVFVLKFRFGLGIHVWIFESHLKAKSITGKSNVEGSIILELYIPIYHCCLEK